MFQQEPTCAKLQTEPPCVWCIQGVGVVNHNGKSCYMIAPMQCVAHSRPKFVIPGSAHSESCICSRKPSRETCLACSVEKAVKQVMLPVGGQTPVNLEWFMTQVSTHTALLSDGPIMNFQGTVLPWAVASSFIRQLRSEVEPGSKFPTSTSESGLDNQPTVSKVQWCSNIVIGPCLIRLYVCN